MPTLLPLRPGDTVAVVAPSGPFPRDRYERGLEVLRGRGFQLREFLPEGPWRYLAAEDHARAASFTAAFAGPEVRAVFVARGGYGAMRILPAVDWAAIARSGKPLIGFSDTTAMHLALLAEGGSSIHGPVLTQLGEQPAPSIDRLFSILAGDRPTPIQGREVVPGSASGPLVGGCLSLVSRLVGTPYLPSLAGSLLLLEDVGEHPYRLDRMWTHLRLAGVLDEVAGVVLGDFTDCDDEERGLPGDEVMAELAATLGKPVAAGLPIGHGPLHLAVPVGRAARIEGGTLHFDAPSVGSGRIAHSTEVVA